MRETTRRVTYVRRTYLKPEFLKLLSLPSNAYFTITTNANGDVLLDYEFNEETQG
jgi:hypothetical protein